MGQQAVIAERDPEAGGDEVQDKEGGDGLPTDEPEGGNRTDVHARHPEGDRPADAAREPLEERCLSGGELVGVGRIEWLFRHDLLLGLRRQDGILNEAGVVDISRDVRVQTQLGGEGQGWCRV